VGLESADAGVKINQVMKDSAAFKAGLKVNDLVLSVAGKAIADAETLVKTLQKYKPGDVVAVRVPARGGGNGPGGPAGQAARSARRHAEPTWAAS